MRGPAGAASRGGAADKKIAANRKWSTREVNAMAERLSGRDHSLNEPVGLDGTDEWEDFLVDAAPSPEETAIQHRDGEIEHRWLVSALDTLSDRERLIIRARRLREDHSTLEELGVRLGITKERVRQIEHSAFRKLQDAVLRESHELKSHRPSGSRERQSATLPEQRYPAGGPARRAGRPDLRRFLAYAAGSARLSIRRVLPSQAATKSRAPGAERSSAASVSSSRSSR